MAKARQGHGRVPQGPRRGFCGRFLGGLAAFILLWGGEAMASEQAAVTNERFQLVGTGLAMIARDRQSDAPTESFWGFGGRAGYTFPADVYLGVLYEHLRGHGQLGAVIPPTLSVSLWQVAAGRDVALLPHWVLRPAFGAGIALRNFECASGHSCPAPARAPAAALRLELLFQTDHWQISAETVFDALYTKPTAFIGAALGIHAGAAF